MANTPSDFSNKINGPVSDYKSKLPNGEHQLESFAQNAGERVGAMANGLAVSAADSMRVSREYVKSNPVKGVAIAAAVGVVTGSLLTMIARGRRS